MLYLTRAGAGVFAEFGRAVVSSHRLQCDSCRCLDNGAGEEVAVPVKPGVVKHET
jgi:hypothetical protein